MAVLQAATASHESRHSDRLFARPLELGTNTSPFSKSQCLPYASTRTQLEVWVRAWNLTTVDPVEASGLKHVVLKWLQNLDE